MWTLDFEASSLNLAVSYPIEVGYTNGVIEREFLIIPHEDWDDWSWESQQIHNLSRRDLFRFGNPGPEICHIMNEDLRGEDIYIDGGVYDKRWLAVLFAYSDMTADFKLKEMPVDLFKEWNEIKKDDVEHRALADAKQLFSFMAPKFYD